MMEFNFDKAYKKFNESLKQFEPIDLNERNVDIIFNRCLANEEEKKDQSKLLFTKVLSDLYSKNDSELILFSKEKAKNNDQNIGYLVGQLATSHTDDKFLVLTDGIKRYDNTIWTRDVKTLFKFYSLAICRAYLGRFRENNGQLEIDKYLPDIIPTLSPTDPNFDKWYKEVYEPRMQKLTQK